jgi:two-component system phosphate regulon response regulator PhoB
MQATTTQPDTVMVVEDEAAISELIAAALEDEGYRVLTARDGHDAMQMVQRAPPDAIVLDLMLPNVDGWQVIRRCRAHPETTAIPIIVVSAAYDAPQDADIEPLVFVEKPFDLDVLLVLVEDAVSPSASDAVA